MPISCTQLLRFRMSVSVSAAAAPAAPAAASISAIAAIAAIDLFANDPILTKMMDPNILWGDLFIEPSASAPAPAVLTRKAIQKKFPVLVRLQSTQSAKRLGIQWNMSKLANLRINNPNPLDWKTYEVQTAETLIDELCSSGWNVYAPSDPSFICSIERVSTTAAQRIGSRWQYEEPDCPTMLCLNDIKLFFPVIWHKVESNDCKMYSIELYNDKIRSMAVNRGVDSERLTNHLSSLLLTTLNQSPAWKVVDSTIPGEHSRIVLI